MRGQRLYRQLKTHGMDDLEQCIGARRTLSRKTLVQAFPRPPRVSLQTYGLQGCQATPS